MAYLLFTPTGSEYNLMPITVPDNAIDAGLYDPLNKLGVQLVGRNSVNYGTAVAQNTLQIVSNFAGSVLPNDTISLQGQLWFNAVSTTGGSLYVKMNTNNSGGISNWARLPSVAPSVATTAQDGDIQVLSNPTRINMWAAGAWRQVLPAQYS
jgi:hypothetical protein